MELKKLDGSSSVCKVTDYSTANLNSIYCSTGKADEENSLVCLQEEAPGNIIEREDHQKASRIQGILDFSLIGILFEISTLLAKKGTDTFAISTYNTNYTLMKEEQLENVVRILAEAGCRIL